MKIGELITVPKYGNIETFRILDIKKSIVFVESASGVKSWLHKATVLQYNK
jgi:hypothetical protein